MKAQSDPWITATPEDVGYRTEALNGDLSALLVENKTAGAALVVDGKLVWERYWYGYDHTCRFDIYSAAKSFTAVAIGLLADDGKLALDDPACRWLPEWAGDGRREITIRHLLTMTSGLKCDYYAFYPIPDSTAAALSWPMAHRPGEVWSYEQATMQALCPIIVRITGRQPIDFLRERILAPIGAREMEWARSSTGDCLTWRSIYCTARDFARWGWFLAQGGAWNDTQLVSRQFVAAMTRVDPIVWKCRTDEGQLDYRRRSWGFGLFVNEDGTWKDIDRSCFAPSGAVGNKALVDPANRMVFVRLSTPEGNFSREAWGSSLDTSDDHGTGRMWRAVLSART